MSTFLVTGSNLIGSLTFWPAFNPPLARLPDEAYVAEVRGSAYLLTPAFIPREHA